VCPRALGPPGGTRRPSGAGPIGVRPLAGSARSCRLRLHGRRTRDPPRDGARETKLKHGHSGARDSRHRDHEPIAALRVRPPSVASSPDTQTSATGLTVSIIGWRAWHDATIVPGSRGVTPRNATTRSMSRLRPVALQAALVGQPVVFCAERGTELVERGMILPLDESHERGWCERGILLDEDRKFVT